MALAGLGVDSGRWHIAHHPLRELTTLRRDHVAYRDVDMGAPQTNLALNPTGVQQLVDYAGESVEVCLTIDR
jgi:hypothetical protein